MHKRGEAAAILAITLVAAVGLFVLFMQPRTTGLAAAKLGALVTPSPCKYLGQDIAEALDEINALQCANYDTASGLLGCSQEGTKSGYKFSLVGGAQMPEACAGIDADSIRTKFLQLLTKAAGDQTCKNIAQSLQDQYCSPSQTVSPAGLCVKLGKKLTAALDSFQANQCDQYYSLNDLVRCTGKKPGFLFLSSQAECNTVLEISKDFVKIQYLAEKETTCQNIAQSIQNKYCFLLPSAPADSMKARSKSSANEPAESPTDAPSESPAIERAATPASESSARPTSVRTAMP